MTYAKRYSRYCGPAALSAVTGIQRELAGIFLKVMIKARYGDEKRVRARTQVTVLVDALQKLGHKGSRYEKARLDTGILAIELHKITDDKSRIFHVTGHAVATKGNRVIEDNKVPSLGKQVLGWIVVE